MLCSMLFNWIIVSALCSHRPNIRKHICSFNRLPIYHFCPFAYCSFISMSPPFVHDDADRWYLCSIAFAKHRRAHPHTHNYTNLLIFCRVSNFWLENIWWWISLFSLKLTLPKNIAFVRAGWNISIWNANKMNERHSYECPGRISSSFSSTSEWLRKAYRKH